MKVPSPRMSYAQVAAQSRRHSSVIGIGCASAAFFPISIALYLRAKGLDKEAAEPRHGKTGNAPVDAGRDKLQLAGFEVTMGNRHQASYGSRSRRRGARMAKLGSVSDVDEMLAPLKGAAQQHGKQSRRSR